MPIYRVSSPGIAESRLREWRRGALQTIGLLLGAVLACATGLVLLDTTSTPLHTKISHALWNAANLLTTLGDFTDFDERQKVFMMGTMLIFLVIGGYALTRLTGILSSEAVMRLRENRTMARQLDLLAGHVIVIGFRPVGQLVAERLRDAGDDVLIVDRDEALAGQASKAGYAVVQGDAGADDAVFERAGVDRARALVVTTEDPDRNLAITLMAHARNPTLAIAVTGISRERGALLQRAGASEVVIVDDLVAGALIGRLSQETRS